MVEQVVRFALKDVKPVDVLQAGLVVAAALAELISPSAVPPQESPEAADPSMSRQSP
jgi:hypothetical protein